MHLHGSCNNLSERYQLSENIRTTRQLTSVLLLHLASNFELSARAVLTYYRFIANDTDTAWFIVYERIFTALVYLLIQFSVIKYAKSFWIDNNGVIPDTTHCYLAGLLSCWAMSGPISYPAATEVPELRGPALT